MNYYCTITAESEVTGTRAEYEALVEDLRVRGDEGEHGFELEWRDAGPRDEYGGIYLFARENGCYPALPPRFLTSFGKLIKRGHLRYLSFGYANYADKPAPGTCGGGNFRITSTGKLIYR